MISKAEFLKQVAECDNIRQVDIAIALLWFYQQTRQNAPERTPSELADELREEGFGRPNVTRLKQSLALSRFTVKAKRNGAFRLNTQYVTELSTKYDALLNIRIVTVRGDLLPPETVAGSKTCFEKITYQINGTYEAGFYDACATLCRRLMESLIIEAFESKGLRNEIRDTAGEYLMLDGLIKKIKRHATIKLARGVDRTIDHIKAIGDRAAHSRDYVTTKQDIDDIKIQYRTMVSNLLALSSLSPKT